MSRLTREETIITKRQRRVQNLIRKEVEEIVRRDMSDPHVESITITAVNVSPDMSMAEISVSFISEKPEEIKRSFESLQKAAAFIRHKLSKKVFLKKTPELEFILDERPEFRVEEILQEIKKEDDERYKR